MSHGPVSHNPSQEQKVRINRINGGKQMTEDQQQYWRNIETNESKRRAKGDAAGQTTTSLPRIISPRGNENLDSYANAFVAKQINSTKNTGLQ